MTLDLIQTLDGLKDTLHMSRQTTNLASRTLKSAQALVADLMRDQMRIEQGVKHIEEGDWQNRIAKRQCRDICGEIVEGFEEVCGEWYRRILMDHRPPPQHPAGVPVSTVPPVEKIIVQ